MILGQDVADEVSRSSRSGVGRRRAQESGVRGPPRVETPHQPCAEAFEASATTLCTSPRPGTSKARRQVRWSTPRACSLASSPSVSTSSRLELRIRGQETHFGCREQPYVHVLGALSGLGDSRRTVRGRLPVARRRRQQCRDDDDAASSKPESDQWINHVNEWIRPGKSRGRTQGCQTELMGISWELPAIV